MVKKKINIYFFPQNRKIKRNTIKTYLDGRTYKLNIKNRVWNFRFNRSNIRYFIFKNLKTNLKDYKRKIYIYNAYPTTNIQNKWVRTMWKIRKYDTYTLRGIHTNKTCLGKRQGRVSTYM